MCRGSVCSSSSFDYGNLILVSFYTQYDVSVLLKLVSEASFWVIVRLEIQLRPYSSTIIPLPRICRILSTIASGKNQSQDFLIIRDFVSFPWRADKFDRRDFLCSVNTQLSAKAWSPHSPSPFLTSTLIIGNDIIIEWKFPPQLQETNIGIIDGVIRFEGFSSARICAFFEVNLWFPNVPNLWNITWM